MKKWEKKKWIMDFFILLFVFQEEGMRREKEAERMPVYFLRSSISDSFSSEESIRIKIGKSTFSFILLSWSKERMKNEMGNSFFLFFKEGKKKGREKILFLIFLFTSLSSPSLKKKKCRKKKILKTLSLNFLFLRKKTKKNSGRNFRLFFSLDSSKGRKGKKRIFLRIFLFFRIEKADKKSEPSILLLSFLRMGVE